MVVDTYQRARLIEEGPNDCAEPSGILMLESHVKEGDGLEVAARLKNAVSVVDESKATGHACGKVATRATQKDHTAACHVLAAVVTTSCKKTSTSNKSDFKKEKLKLLFSQRRNLL